jgi:hypothetical protein
MISLDVNAVPMMESRGSTVVCVRNSSDLGLVLDAGAEVTTAEEVVDDVAVAVAVDDVESSARSDGALRQLAISATRTRALLLTPISNSVAMSRLANSTVMIFLEV